MRYIHEQSGWPALRWDPAAVMPHLVAVRHKQGRLLGRMSALGFELRTEASVSVLTSDVVKSSAIEGEILNPDEVRSSIALKLGLDNAGLPKPGRHVEGIVELMLDATQRFEETLGETRLFRWHDLLFPDGRSNLTRITTGAWRRGAMHVISGPIGRERVHFQAPDATRVQEEMATFLGWFNGGPLPGDGAFEAIDPVLRASLAHFWFVTVHPFDDGNGRIARAIADMSLARADGTRDRFYSMSAQIERERPDYYAELERAQRGSLDVTGWHAWFLGCLERAIDGAEHALEAVLRKERVWRSIHTMPVNERQRVVLNRLMGEFVGHMTTSKYAKIAKCSTDTALRDIRELVEWKVLAPNPGGGRSTSYRLAVPAVP